MSPAEITALHRRGREASLRERLADAGERLRHLTARPEGDGIEIFISVEAEGDAAGAIPPKTLDPERERRAAVENLVKFFRSIETVSPRTRLFVMYEHLREAWYDCSLHPDDAYCLLEINESGRLGDEALDLLEEILRAFCGAYGEAEGYVIRSSEVLCAEGGSKILVYFVPLH